MIPQNKIKQRLTEFLQDPGAITIMDNCVLTKGASWLNNQIKLSITQSDKNEIVIEIRNNSHQGFTEFKKEYSI